MIPRNGQSPFEHLKQIDADGREIWSARDLLEPMGYDRWERFEDAIERAIAAAENSGVDPLGEFRGAAKITSNARGQQRKVLDWHLSRYAAYLVAMNGDPRKPEIAAAQTYFAVKTREAETAAPAVPVLPSPRELAALVIAEADRADAAEARVAELEPKAAAHDTYLSVGSGDRLVREVAKLLGWRQQDLRQFLIAERLIFARPSDCGSMQWDFYAGHERHFRSAEHVVEHRSIGLCSHYTLHVRPAGVDLIQRRIARRQAERDEMGGAA